MLPVFAGLLMGNALVGVAQAQDAGGCPQLPAGTTLVWEHKATGDSDFCRAIREDGSEAFGLYISPKATFQPKRGDRAEAGLIDGREMHWYRGELATKPDMEVRETLIQLDDGRVAHIWLQANPADLPALIGQAQSMRMPNTRLSSK